MKILSLKAHGSFESIHLPIDDDSLLVTPDTDEPIIAEDLAEDSAAILIYIPPYYDLDALLIQLNVIAKRQEHQPAQTDE